MVMFVNGGLEADPGGNIDVEDELLDRLFDLGVIQTVIVDKRGQEGVEIGDSLGAGGLSLQGVEEIDDLAQGRPKMPGRRTLHLPLDALESLFEQVFQVPSHAVDRQQTQVMDVKIAPVCADPGWQGDRSDSASTRK